MRNMLTLLALLATITFANAQGYHWVIPHYDHNGNFYNGHYQTNPDGNPFDNWSTRGNYNPFTGTPGYRDPYNSYGSYGYGGGYGYGGQRYFGRRGLGREP